MLEESPNEGTVFLYLFAAVAGFIFLLLLLIWALSGRKPGMIVVSIVASGLISAGIFVAGRKVSAANRDWHAGTYTFANWPLVAGSPVAVTYELRRRNPVAAHPRMSVSLLLRQSEYRKDGPDRMRTVDRRALEIETEKQIEPVTLEFQVEVPVDWLRPHADDGQILLQVARGTDDLIAAYPIELAIEGL